MNAMLEDYVYRYMIDQVDYDAVVEACERLEPTQDHKEQLLSCIDSYDLDVLYHTLFDTFDDMLTDEERRHYQERYHATFDRKEG